ncbi:MAG: hypothetical protein ACKVJG_10305 [Candidatus Latescibacterota bacterium]|jgi:hypothetical protein
MKLGPISLDDEEAREKIAQILEGNRPRPFAEELDAWLEQYWKKNAKIVPPCPVFLAGMIRDEDKHIVLDHASRNERQKEAFYLFWASGLFREASLLLKEYPQVKQEIGFIYMDEDGADFKASYMLSKWRIYNGPKGVLASLYHDGRHLWSAPVSAHHSRPIG